MVYQGALVRILIFVVTLRDKIDKTYAKDIQDRVIPGGRQ